MKLQSFENPFETDRLNAAANFRPDWDVPSIGADVTARLDRDIEAIRHSAAPDPARKIHVLVGSSGYGKTHFFGRLYHHNGERIHFVFVPHASQAMRSVVNVQWYTIETLFQPAADGIAPLVRIFSHLLRESFEAYFSQLPGMEKARHTSLRQRLKEDWRTVPEIIAPITGLAPYHALADDIAKRFPKLRTDVVRGLVLGLSPVAAEIRQWLRGEELQADRCKELRLGAPPDARNVLLAIAVLLQQVQTPLVVCLDQIEALLNGDAEALRPLTAVLMSWLQEIPNFLMILGCMSENWSDIRTRSYSSFSDRVQEHKLGQLTENQAMQLVKKRMTCWEQHQPDKGDGWPFDLNSVAAFVQKNLSGPRGFIQTCAAKFTEWEAGNQQGLISLASGPVLLPLPEQFLAEWNKQAALLKQTPKAAIDFQDLELWEGVHEALEVARVGKLAPAGITVARIQNQALQATASDARPSAEVQLAVGTKRLSIVVAVSKKDSGQAFGRYIDALDDAMGGNVAGAVLVWPKTQLGVGPKTVSYIRYKEKVIEGKIRPFNLDEQEATFSPIECLRQMIRRVKDKDLQLIDAHTRKPFALTIEDCRQLIVETKLLDNLKLFEIAFAGWPAVEAARAAAAKAPVAQPAVANVQPAAANVPATKPAPAAIPVARPAPIPVGGPTTIPLARPVKVPPTAPAAKPMPPTPPTPTLPPADSGSAWANEMLALVVQKLHNWGQPVKARGVEIGPSFVRLMVEPRDQTDIGKVRKKADNLKLHLSLAQRPLIDGQAGYISIDVQRPDRQTVKLLPLLKDAPAKLRDRPAFPVGVDVGGRAHWLDLGEPASCHLLIAGTTGSGKSEFMKALLAALAHGLGPDRLQFVLIDPKQVTFNFRGSSPYLAKPVAHDVNDALPLIEECVDEMERRYSLLKQRNVENVSELTGADALPRRVVLFDEFADLMVDKASKKDLETHLKRLGAKARAAGIHLILGTQRTEASIVTPLLRSNLPGRISLQVIGEKDSKLILEAPEAAHLLGKGDLLWRQGGGLLRLQSPFVAREELETLLRFH